jgi:hypothetical protein
MYSLVDCRTSARCVPRAGIWVRDAGS